MSGKGAPISMAWTHPDLMCVPNALLEQLITLWNGFRTDIVHGQRTLTVQKIVNPKKKETTLSMKDVRLITILSFLYPTESSQKHGPKNFW